MPVLARSDLEASPLADLHAIADQLGLDGFRRLRKPELIDTILAHDGPGGAASAGSPAEAAEDGQEEERAASTSTRRRAGRLARVRSRRARGSGEEEERGSDEGKERGSDEGEERGSDEGEERGSDEGEERGSGEEGGRGSRGSEARGSREDEQRHDDDRPGGARSETEGRARDQAAREPRERGARGAGRGGETAEGVVEVLGNGSAFLRVSPPDPSDEDIYISAAQVRRCELVSGDRVTGPVRTPRRSERYPSLVRIDTINGQSADAVASGARYEDLPAVHPSERLAIGGGDATLEAIEWLTPLGRGSRALIVGPPRAGKTETLRALAHALAAREEPEITLVLLGVRPEEITVWQEGPLAPAVSLTFASPADAQGQALEQVLEGARRVAARGGHALVLVDSLDALAPAAARRALASARNLRDAGSLTLIATAGAPLGGESTVIALDPALTSTGRKPILDLAASGTLRPELLVGEDGALAITKARAQALEASD